MKVAVVYLCDNKGQRKDVFKYSPRGKRGFLDKEAFDMAALSGPPDFAKAHLIAFGPGHRQAAHERRRRIVHFNEMAARL